MTTHDRTDWIDIAKAFSITLVVMLYATLSVGESTGEIGFLHWAVAFATPIRMPEFFLISGLFLAKVISRPWLSYADRRVTHYIYFYVLWTVILCAFKFGLVDGDPLGALGNIAALPYRPYSALWFIYALAIFGVIVKGLYEFRIPHWVALTVGAILQVSSTKTGFFLLDYLAEYFVFFYAGYAFGPAIVGLIDRLARQPFRAIGLLIVWASINAFLVFGGPFALSPDLVTMGFASIPGLHLLLAFTGVLALLLLAALIARTPLKSALSYLGRRTLPVYLSFLIPMAIAREILIRLGITDTGTVSAIAMMAGLVLPLVAFEIIRHIGWARFAFERPAWAIANRARTPSMRGTVPAE